MRVAILASVWLVFVAIGPVTAADRSADSTSSSAYAANSKLRSPEQNPRDFSRRWVVSDGHPSEFLYGEVVGRRAARTDTVYLLGGPGTLTGKFETASGAPDRQGWVGVDWTTPEGPFWHIDTYHCANLDPGTVPNHAWWCGQYFPWDCDDGDFGGYGNGWRQYLNWYGTVPDPVEVVTVRIAAVLNHDVELNYDFLYLQVESAGEWQDLRVFNDIGVGLPVDISFNLTPADYVGEDADQVHLRWFFESDGAWSDEDCMYPSQGAAQLDLIAVFFDQGGGEFQVGESETCEPGDPVQLDASVPPGVGDFSKVWPRLRDIDPCLTNNTPQFAFIDDGIVVPGTGGYLCTTWCYGPQGHIVNPEGGLAGPGEGWEHHLRNHIYSPVLPWPGPSYDGLELRFEVWRHEDLSMDSPGIGDIWLVRSTASEDPADIEFAGWMDRDSGMRYGGPAYLRYHLPVSDLLEPDRKFVQMSLGAWQWGWILGWIGTDGSPAPYFDNVAIVAYEFGGPSIRTRELELAQDSFPAGGTIDYDNLGNNSVRFDMAWNISPADHLRNDPGDSITAGIQAIRTGSVLNDLPRLYYHLNPNLVFDPYRSSGLPNQGWVEGDSVFSSSGHFSDRFSFDLPDTGFFFPGDVIHYYLEAQDNQSGDIATTLLPGDTTGFHDFGEFTPFPSSFIVRALPTLFSGAEGDQPQILFWNDFGNFGGEEEWRFALRNQGYLEGINYDLYYTNWPSSGVGNGLGGRASAAQMQGYDILLYSCGDLNLYTFSNGDFDSDAGNDVSVLDSWLRLGGKNMFLTGDDLVFDLWNNGGATTQSFINDWLGVSFVNEDGQELIGGQRAPLVQYVPGNPVFSDIAEWIAYKSCPSTVYWIGNTFDAVEAVGTAVRLAEFTDSEGNPGAYPYSAATLYHDPTYDANTISLPYDLMFVYTPPGGGDGTPRAMRSRLLEEVLTYFGMPPSGQPVDVPAAAEFSVRSYPNPFNPSTKIEYTVSQAGHVRLTVLDARGREIATLVDEHQSPQAYSVTWDGRDGKGQSVASGVYFCTLKAGETEETRKMTLLK